MILIYLSAIVGVAYLVKRAYQSYTYYSPSKFPPGPTKWPVVGNLWPFRKSPLTAMLRWKYEYGDIVGIRLGDLRTIILNDYDLIKEAFSNDAFNGRPEFKPAMMFTGGNEHGTLTSIGDPWDTIRRFTIKNLNALGFGRKSMEGFLQQDIDALVEDLHTLEGKPVNLHGRFYIPAINHLFYILTGSEIPAGQKTYFYETIANLNTALWQPIGYSIWFLPWLTSIFPKWTGLSRLEQRLPKFKSLIKDKISEHRQKLEAEGVTDKSNAEHLVDAFLKEILTARSPSSHFYGAGGTAHMEGMTLNLFVTAAEAMNNTMQWVLMYLSLYPEVQERVAQEIATKLGGRAPTLDDMIILPYTKAVMIETMRIATTSPFSNFQMTVRDVEFQGYSIPKDTCVIANLYGLHHDPEVWPAPEEFLPERWLRDEHNTGLLTINPDMPPMIPFSVGLRTCLGQTFARNEFFMFLVNLIREFRWEWPEDVPKLTKDEITENSRVSIFRFCPKFTVIPHRRVGGVLATP